VDIAILVPYFPFPPNRGGRARVWNIVKRLAPRHLVHLACVDSAPSVEHLATLAAVCASVHVAPPRVRSTLRSKLRLALTAMPEIVGLCTVPLLARHLQELYERRPIDVTLLEQLSITGYLPLVRTLSASPIVLTEQNVESDLCLQFARNQPRSRTRLRQHLEALKLTRWERWAIGAVDHCVAVSHRDQQILERLNPRATCSVIENGVDVDFFRPGPPLDERQKSVIFVGTLAWPPNLDGALFFLREVFPFLKRREPRLRFKIVGSSPLPELRAVARSHDSVDLLADVDDIRPHVAASAVFVVPLRMGGGTRLKILDAWAQGIPVVSTSVGCEGLDARHERHLLIADTPDAMVKAILTLLNDAELWTRLARAGRRLVEERYSWTGISDQFEALLSSVTQSTRGIPTPTPRR
jgi:glycosyltransferase involved in cell wall biosynthesis